MTPSREVVVRIFVQNTDQSFPGSISVGIRFQVFLNPFPERLLPHFLNQHFQDNRRLVIDDIAVHQSGIPHILQLLLYRIGTGGTVFGIGCRDIIEHEVQGMVHLRKQRLDHLGGIIIGKNLFCPDIIEPFHRHEIPEPHMRSLVRNQGTACQTFVQCRIFVQEHPAVRI